MYLTFNDVLLKCGITDLSRVLLIRHSLSHDNFAACYADYNNRRELVKTYTACQKIGFKGRFDYWAVFISSKSTFAKLYCVYKVGDCIKTRPDLKPANYPISSDFSIESNEYLYELEEFREIEEYNDRLVIDWGKAAISWFQIAGRQPKKIVSIMDNERKAFPGFDNIMLSYYELLEMVDDPVKYEAWHSALSSVYGIYLIVNKKNGDQYVGSATGTNGILGRWSEYAYGHTGGDKRLIELMKKEPKAYENFQFTILRILPKDMPQAQVIGIESLYKEKLGSRVFGLNAN